MTEVFATSERATCLAPGNAFGITVRCERGVGHDGVHACTRDGDLYTWAENHATRTSLKALAAKEVRRQDKWEGRSSERGCS